MSKAAAIIFLLLICTFPAQAAHEHLEKDYQAVWCIAHHGTMEYVLDDGARVDCFTKNYAIEFDFAPKWAESIGQAIYYSIKTGKKPGVVLILEKDNDRQHLIRLQRVAKKNRIRVWVMRKMK